MDKIIIIDFGSQYSKLIARRVREADVYSEIVPPSISIQELAAMNPKGIILSGGPASVYAPDAPHCSSEIFNLGIPILGICYGMQLMCKVLGGDVTKADKREYGKADVALDNSSPLFQGLDKITTCWMSHGDHVRVLPPGFKMIGQTGNAPFAAVCDEERRLYGLQFHPEVTHTPQGMNIIKNFLYNICGCKGDWTTQSFIEETIKTIRNEIGDKRAICALSGGVDSSVAAILVQKAIGGNLNCIFVNNGLLRKDEVRKVKETFRDKFSLNLTIVDAEDRFLHKLAGVTDPEEKRKIIGREFIAVFEEEASKIGDIDYLVQGTLYPDVIESVSVTGPAAKIKSHHNVGGLPEVMHLKLVEPLRNLFKDEVRKVGKELGLPDDIVWRHPFPGPGLAVRCLGEVTREKLDILREADAIIIEEIKKAGIYRDLWQVFAVLTGVRSVGVMGDERTYSYIVGMRAVTSEDAMTADWARLPYELLERISNRVINEVKGVNRLVYDISSKPPATIEWE